MNVQLNYLQISNTLINRQKEEVEEEELGLPIYAAQRIIINKHILK